MHQTPTYLAMLFLLGLVLSGCAGETNDPAAAVQAVEKYLQAKVDGDADALAPLLCLDKEADLDNEARTFATVTGVEINEMACSFNDGENTVTCTGEIVATYGTQDRAFPLRTYQVVLEDGEWKWCGEA